MVHAEHNERGAQLKELHLDNWSSDDIHAAFNRFEMKWRIKADKLGASDRISRL